jgi:hypothetical protein
MIAPMQAAGGLRPPQLPWGSQAGTLVTGPSQSGYPMIAPMQAAGGLRPPQLPWGSQAGTPVTGPSQAGFPMIHPMYAAAGPSASAVPIHALTAPNGTSLVSTTNLLGGA